MEDEQFEANVDDAVHAVLAAFELNAKSEPDLATKLNDAIREIMA